MLQLRHVTRQSSDQHEHDPVGKVKLACSRPRPTKSSFVVFRSCYSLMARLGVDVKVEAPGTLFDFCAAPLPLHITFSSRTPSFVRKAMVPKAYGSKFAKVKSLLSSKSKSSP